MQVAIFKNELDTITVIRKAPSSTKTIDELAKIITPTGQGYKIMDEADIPTDRAERMQWTVDDADLNSGVGL